MVETSPAPPNLPVARRLLYAALTTLLFAAALEGALAALGLANPAARLSLTRGFSTRARYFVPDPAQPGTVHTQMFSGDSPEVVVPPRGPRVRVLLMGESSTEGFPEEYIQERLDAALPDPGFEVINLGRHGYGSERVRILLAQALELHPDVVFIYLGHNEFVEQGFALELAREWHSGVALEAVDWLARLRTMNAAIEVAESIAPGPSARPESQQAERADAFRELTYDRTVLFYKVYRDNLAAMVELAREAGAGVLLSTVVPNDFDPPAVSTFPVNLPETTRADVFRLRGLALGAIPERFRKGLIQTSPEAGVIHLRPSDWGELAPPAELAARRARAAVPAPPELRALSAPFAGPPLWSDPRDWSAAVPELLDTCAQVVQRAPTEDERRLLSVTATRLNEVLTICPDHPITLFELGLVRYLLGDDDGAARLLHAAAAYDRAPTHGNDVINGVVRELAAQHADDPDVRCVDAEQLVRAACPEGLVGYELMMDNCHLHAQARYALVDMFVPQLLELGRAALTRR
ncbi:MAG TPA: SGNH/GDSL hydrolase family protein [Planctomycetota bacterium]|nr:SGNH/GDSL hydrolase family protein [Planctomycetota bacterium]